MELMIIAPDSALVLAGEAANAAASANVFADYRSRVAQNTLRRQAADLALFERYLAAAGVTAHVTDAPGWRGVTWGLVAGFVQWMLGQGYAVGTVNVRLTTVKRYAELAAQAGVIAAGEAALIRTVRGYGFKQARKVDEKRDTVRTGDKKAQATPLTKEQADSLKGQPDTPQGRRDALLMCLLLDHGLRCGEIAALRADAVDLALGTFTFYREKVGKTQRHRMTVDTFRAATVYCAFCPPVGLLLAGSKKNGDLTGGLSVRAINARVGVLGRAIGVENLSPHDCRHYWATRAARQGTDPFALQEAGGWNSLAMPRRYVEAAKIANEGVRL